MKRHIYISILIGLCWTWSWGQSVNLLCIENGARMVDYSPTDWGIFLASFDSYHDIEAGLFCSEKGTPFPHFFTYELAITAEISALEFSTEVEEIAYPGISAKEVNIYAALTNEAEFKFAQSFTLDQNQPAQQFEVTPFKARRLKFEIISNYGQKAYTEIGKVKAFGQFEELMHNDRITGSWSTTFGEMRIPLTEPFVTGCFTNGSLHGTFQKRVLSFYWTEDQQHGIVSAILNEEADALIGFWGSENGTYEPWNGSLLTSRISECPEDPINLQLNSIGETMLFNFQADLPDTNTFETQAILAGAIKFLMDNPDKKLTIESYMNTPESTSEKVLAELWALRVKKYFTSNGIENERLNIRGISEARPLADTATITGKSLNQRIRLRVQ